MRRGGDRFGDGEGVAAGKRRIEHVADLRRIDRDVQVERRGGELRDDRQLFEDRRFDRREIGNVFAEREQRTANRLLASEARGARQGRLRRRPGDIAPRQRRPEARRLNEPRHPAERARAIIVVCQARRSMDFVSQEEGRSGLSPPRRGVNAKAAVV